MLKGACVPDYFCERFSIVLAPSLTSTRFKPKGLNKPAGEEEKLSSFVVGNPKLPSSVIEHWGWSDVPRAAKEAENIAEILQTPSSNVLTGEKATKSAVLAQLPQAECIHFACHISWQLSAIVLSPGEFVDSNATESSPNQESNKNKRFSTIEEESEDTNSETNSSTTDMPALSDFMLTAADILNCKLSAKLVVLSCGHANDDEDQGNSIKSSEGLIALTKAILAAGAQCVVVTLWPVPDSAVNLVMKPLYSALLQGTRISRAMADAIITVQNTKHFAHPANWSGFALIGSDIRLSNRVALMSQALRDILTHTDNCRDILRVSLHLVEKSLQRISRAMADAIITVQNTKHFAHPANWSGFALIGSDIRLSNRVALMSQALRDILTHTDNCRDILRVSLHLVEKSLQRISRGSKTAMYTSQQSIEKKVHANESGATPNQSWKDLLMSVGFRFEPASNGILPSVFFPQSDPGERLTQCSASLQAILGLNTSSWKAMAKLCESCPAIEASDEIIALFRQVVVHMTHGESNYEVGIDVPVNVRLWRVPGCHELLASLGFDLMEVGREDVTLKTGKSANRRQIQFALQALLALFDPQEAPRSIEMDEEETSEEDEIITDEIDQAGHIHPGSSPMPSPRKHSFILDGNRSSAFTSYRKRGEPDGRQSNQGSPTTPATSTSSSSASTPLTAPNFRYIFLFKRFISLFSH